MSAISFKRVKRDCGFNEKLDAFGADRGFIYDYDIFVDKERRGRWHRIGRGDIGYELQDMGGAYVKRANPNDGGWGRSKITVRKQDYFEVEFRRALDEGLVPSSADVWNRRLQSGEAEVAASMLMVESNRRSVIADAAIDLYDAARQVLAHVEDEHVERINGQCTLCYTYRKLLRDALQKADGRAA